MKPVYSRLKRRAKPRSYYGLPKREFTRRLAGVNLSYRDSESEIKRALSYIEDFLAHVRQLPCAICGRKHNSEAHHVLTRGSFAPDFYNAVPACAPGFDACHQRVQDGEEFTDRDGVLIDLSQRAISVTVEYLADHPDVTAWLQERGVEQPAESVR